MTEALLKNKKGRSVHPARRTFHEAEVFKKEGHSAEIEKMANGERAPK